MSRRTILAGATTLAASLFLLVPGATAEAKPKGDTTDHVTFHSWSFRDATVGGTYDPKDSYSHIAQKGTKDISHD